MSIATTRATLPPCMGLLSGRCNTSFRSTCIKINNVWKLLVDLSFTWLNNLTGKWKLGPSLLKTKQIWRRKINCWSEQTHICRSTLMNWHIYRCKFTSMSVCSFSLTDHAVNSAIFLFQGPDAAAGVKFLYFTTRTSNPSPRTQLKIWQGYRQAFPVGNQGPHTSSTLSSSTLMRTFTQGPKLVANLRDVIHTPVAFDNFIVR